MGEQQGTLLVGSGNLTFGGWRENGEIWMRFDSEVDGTGPFHALRRFLETVLTRVAIQDAVAREVEEAFDPSSKAWLSMETTAEEALIGRAGSGPALLGKLLAVTGDEPVEDLYVCSPYFDHDGVALRDFVTGVGARRAFVLCQAGRTALHQRAWEPNAATATLQKIDFKHLGFGGRERSAFVHAKFYGFRRPDSVVLLAGSANCSRAALTMQGNGGNAELMAVQVLTPQAFKEEYLDELHVSSEPVALPQEPPVENEEEVPVAALRVLGARFEAGCLLVGFAPSHASVTKCLVDGQAVPFAAPENGVLSVSCGFDPKIVVIRAWMDSELIDSEPAWVDLERQLRATAHGRLLADSFRARVQAGEWSPEGWAEVLDVFCRHLAYMPVIRLGIASPRPGRNGSSDALEFTAADVFDPDYRAPIIDRLWLRTRISGDGQVHSLQQLLLRWFGIEARDVEEDPEVYDDNNDPDGDEVVDRPEHLQLAPPSDGTPTDRSARRIAKIVDQLEATMTNPEFVSKRDPDYLATDLKVASALLSVGLGMGWIEPRRFFELTHSIWSLLFFARTSGEVGWLEYRASVESPEVFVRSMQSAELSAALIGWYLAALRSESQSLEVVRFTLAAAVAVGRLPWLWHGGNQEDIEKELAVLLAHTTGGSLEHEERIQSAETEWVRLVQRGQALRCLEDAVRDMRLDVIREKIRIDELAPGEMLWQGTEGFCVVLGRCPRSDRYKVPVLKLQGDFAPAKFRADKTVPVRALLEQDVIPPTRNFGEVPRRVLHEFTREFSTGMAIHLNDTSRSQFTI